MMRGTILSDDEVEPEVAQDEVSSSGDENGSEKEGFLPLNRGKLLRNVHEASNKRQEKDRTSGKSDRHDSLSEEEEKEEKDGSESESENNRGKNDTKRLTKSAAAKATVVATLSASKSRISVAKSDASGRLKGGKQAVGKATKEGKEGKEEEKATVFESSFRFDTGEVGHSDDEGDTSEWDDKEYDGANSDQEECSEEEGEGVDDEGDRVRLMPRSEDRLARALKKHQKQAQNPSNFSDKSKDSGLKNKSKKSVGNQEPRQDTAGMDEEAERGYFDSVIEKSQIDSDRMTFAELNLSRPFLRAVESMGYVSPTPIQAKVIPIAMAGRDVCASAITGSGKTAAFVLPFLERLLYRPKNMSAIRVMVVSPTRELATQSYEVLLKLAAFTDISAALICGGKKDLRAQEAELRAQPDVVICTPGRMLDHLRNSQSVSLDDLDVLVLDEVDRLLDMGFQEEVEELVKHCPVSDRQTMLFSATMTPKVEDLVKLSLKRPVRVKAGVLGQDGSAGGGGGAAGGAAFAPRLVQEFIKLRNEERDKESVLLALLKRGFGTKTIVFFERKKNAHRFHAICKLQGLEVSELHGDLPQAQRYNALERFRRAQADVLIATDVAARGLDIAGVHTVINAEMPINVSTYVHRVGRTARAGSGGRAITLVADSRRKLVKAVLKGEGGAMVAGSKDAQVLSRSIPAPVLAHFQGIVEELDQEIEALFEKERMEKRLSKMEEDTARAENLLTFNAEIKARPARTWYQTETQKKTVKELSLQHKTDSENQFLKSVAEKNNSSLLLESGKKSNPFGTNAAKKAADLARRDDYRMEEDGEEGKQNRKKGLLPKTETNKHRLTRKKRRRLEAFAEEEQEVREKEREVKQRKKEKSGANSEENDGGGDDFGEHELDEANRKLARQKKALELAPRHKKNTMRDRLLAEREKTIGELGMKKVKSAVKLPIKSRSTQGEERERRDGGGGDDEDGEQYRVKSKVVRQKMAFGGIDQDFLTWSGADKKQKSTKGAVGKGVTAETFTDFDNAKTLRRKGKLSAKGFKSKGRYKRR